jgi:DNA-binding NarL/FixJ family response regulator
MRQIIKKIASDTLNLHVVMESSTAKDALLQFPKTKPEILVLDLQLPDEGGLELLTQWKLVGLRTRVLIHSAYCNRYLALRLKEFCISGFLYKAESTLKRMEEAIASVRCGMPFFSQAFQELRNQIAHDPEPIYKMLTDQQLTIFYLVAQHLTDTEIAGKLSITLRTVETHRIAIMRKLSVHTRIGLINVADSLGYIKCC